MSKDMINNNFKAIADKKEEDGTKKSPLFLLPTVRRKRCFYLLKALNYRHKVSLPGHKNGLTLIIILL